MRKLDSMLSVISSAKTEDMHDYLAEKPTKKDFDPNIFLKILHNSSLEIKFINNLSINDSPKVIADKIALKEKQRISRCTFSNCFKR